VAEVAGFTFGANFEADVALEYLLPVHYDREIKEYTFI